jgi:hypothetical protein
MRAERRRNRLAGAILFERARVDRDFAKTLLGIFEKHLESKDRGILMELMEEWGWPTGKA